MPKVRAAEIKKALSEYVDPYSSQIFFEVKNGSTWFSDDLLIMDALEIKKSWRNPCFTGYEIKVSRQDFLRDEKWHGYLPYCHKFYFLCPKGLIKKKEIEAMDKNVGLIYYSKDYATNFHTMKAPVYKNIGIPERDILYYIIMSKLESDRYPFFSSQKEHFKEWLENGKENKELGKLLRKEISYSLFEQGRELNALRKQVNDFAEQKQIFEKVIGYLETKGLIRGWSSKELKDNWREKLDNVFESTLSDRDKQKIKNVIDEAERLKPLVEDD